MTRRIDPRRPEASIISKVEKARFQIFVFLPGDGDGGGDGGGGDGGDGGDGGRILQGQGPYPNAPRDEISRKGYPLTLI